MKLISTNSKTKYSLNLPVTGTCHSACPHINSICYATKGRFIFGSVKQANQRRLDLYQVDPDIYFDWLTEELIRLDLKHIRIFGSGDFPDQEYAYRLLEMVNHKQLTDTQFWISSFKAGVLPSWKPVVETLNQQPNTLIRLSVQSKQRRRHFNFTSSVSSNPQPDTDTVLCPGTTCGECGFKCWKKTVKHVLYREH